MTRPIDETWSADGGCIDLEAPYVPHIGQFGHSSAVQADSDLNAARARLAAQAPAMARLLLERSTTGYEWECPTCGADLFPGRDVPVGADAPFDASRHAPDCGLVAVLRAAGAVE